MRRLAIIALLSGVAQKANGVTCLRNDECESHLCQMGVCADPPVCF